MAAPCPKWSEVIIGAAAVAHNRCHAAPVGRACRPQGAAPGREGIPSCSGTGVEAQGLELRQDA